MGQQVGRTVLHTGVHGETSEQAATGLHADIESPMTLFKSQLSRLLQ